MRIYKRTEERPTKNHLRQEEHDDYWYHYEWRFEHSEPYDSITVEDLRRGWLLELLIKLNLRSPKEWIKELYW